MPLPRPDPRFGQQAPMTAAQSVVLLSGLTYAAQATHTISLASAADPWACSPKRAPWIKTVGSPPPPMTPPP